MRSLIALALLVVTGAFVLNANAADDGSTHGSGIDSRLARLEKYVDRHLYPWTNAERWDVVLSLDEGYQFTLMGSAPCTDPNGAVLALDPNGFAVTGATASNFGAMIGGTVSMAPLAFGEGYTCILPFHHTNFRAAIHLSDVTGQVNYDESEIVPFLLPGTTYHFQYWYRIPTSPTGHSMTNLLTVDFGPVP